MNKDKLNNIILGGGVVDLDKYINSAKITIKEDTIINAINLHNNMDLKMLVKSGKNLVINMFDYAVNLNTHLEIELEDRSNLTINCTFIAEVKYELDIDTKLYGDNIETKVNIRGINEPEGIVRITMNGTVAGNTKGNVIEEYAHILNKSRLSNIIIPNLIINTNEVEANHGVTIGQISEDELFYMMSKGINRSTATKIIEEGFIKEGLDLDVKEKIQNILVGR